MRDENISSMAATTRTVGRGMRMDAVNLLKEYKRMCDFYDVECGECELNAACSHHQSCDEFLKSNPEEGVAIVEQWTKEHPVRTQ